MPDTPAESVFDEVADAYDALIDWPARLRNEESLFRRLFDDHDVRRVLDTACGTGRHAAMFHSWGASVEGADISPAMIARCQGHFGEPEGLRWVVRPFTEPAEYGRFDAAICIGNSLSLAGGPAEVRRAVAAMLGSLRSGGICVIQVLNLWRLPEGPSVWPTCRRLNTNGAERILMKGLHRVGDRGYIDLIDLTIRAGDLHRRIDSPSFRGLSVDEIASAVESADGQVEGVFGDYHDGEYRPERSPDLIVIARRVVANSATFTE
jgi:SAM-dependent methyltransferase